MHYASVKITPLFVLREHAVAGKFLLCKQQETAYFKIWFLKLCPCILFSLFFPISGSFLDPLVLASKLSIYYPLPYLYLEQQNPATVNLMLLKSSDSSSLSKDENLVKGWFYSQMHKGILYHIKEFFTSSQAAILL